MEKNVKELELIKDLEGYKRGYDLDQNLNQEDEDLMESFVKEYSGSTYMCDAIMEIADNAISVYNNDICENCWGLYSSGAYEDASSEGLMEGSNDLIKNLQCAWGQYNSRQLYNNIDELIYNWAINHIEGYDKYLTEEEMDTLESDLSNIDSNNTFDDIEEVIDNIIADREEEEEEE